MKRFVFTLACWVFTQMLFAQDPTKPDLTPTATQPSAVPPAPAEYSTKGAEGVEGAAAAEASAQKDYIDQYKEIAITEMDRVGIPASIKLAQGILESASGQSELATQANNHFGVKCSGGWDGKTFKKIDDEKDEDGNPKESCFRKYSRAEESFVDHSEFLRDPRKYYRYGSLFALDKRDYRGWARGLEAAGYATGAGYADKLIGLIERLQLHQFDNPETRDMNVGPTKPGQKPGSNTNGGGKRGKNSKDDDTPFPTRITRINDVKLVLSRDGETIDDIARTFRVSPEKVAAYNERRYTPGQKLGPSTRVFIQEKKKKWRGRTKHHYVREGQSMFEISQIYGIRVAELMRRNGMVPGQEAATGERVRLRGNRSSNELVRLRDTPIETRPGTTPSGNNRPTTTKPANTAGEELFELDGNSAGKPTTPSTGGNKPSTAGNTPPANPAPTKPATNPAPTAGNKPSTSQGGGVVIQPQNPSTPPVDPTPAPTANQPGFHTVVKGDTLFSISRKYNIPVAKLKSMNGMTNDNIKIGQQLRVQ
jgi:flagellum-specific peptidoglycan hydrolase FlgJ/LysM repeat protein